jgi:YD repeat-containing protein
MTLMTTRRLATIAALLLMVGLAGEGYGRIVCPNRDAVPGPYPEGPSCPDEGGGGGGGGGGGTGGGGGSNCDSESAGGSGSGGGAGVGDPIMLDKGFVIRRENDFSLSVKHGLTLDLKRIYSSTPNAADGFGISQSNSAGDGMFGLNWYCPYEQHLEGLEYIDEWGYYEGVAFIDERGGMRHFDYVNTNTWRSRLDQGAPLELTRTGTGSSTVYSLRGGDNSLRKFRSDGKIIELIPDANQSSVSLIFEYYPTGSAWNWDNNLWKVHAPGGDDRYLEFEYHTYGWNRKVYNAWTKTSTAAYKVGTYWYDGNGYLQSAKGQGPGQTYWFFYEYGSFNPASSLTNPGVPLTPSTAGAILGRVSYFTDGETVPRPLTAYTYGESFSNSASRQWNWDVSTPTPQWRQVLKVVADPWNHNPIAYYGDGVPNTTGGPNDPATYMVTDYQCDVAQMSYNNTPSSMPPTNLFGPGQTSQGNGANKNRLPGSMQRQDGGIWYKEWEYVYNLTTQTGYSLSDPEYLAQHRVNAFHQYFAPNLYNATTYTYHSNTVASGFWYKPIRVTNPAGEYVEYEYFAPGTADQSRLKAIIKSGLRTEYTYNAAGLVWKIKDVQYNTETVFTYDSRGNATQISYPDGNVVTRTHNDFGQVLTETITHLGTTTYTYSDSLSTSDPEYCLPPRLVEVEDANGQTTRYYYDSTGDITKVVDANNKETEIFYNNRGVRTQVKNPNGESVYYGYDVYERMNKFTDGRGKSTLYEHDMFGRVVKETDPDGYFTTYTYTDNSIGGSGGCGSCSGGGANLVARVVRQDGTGVRFRYDWAGRLTEVDSESIGAAGSSEVYYYYDAASRITSVYDTRLTLGDGNYIFTYDSGAAKTGRLERIQHPNGWAQEYYYEDSAASAHYRRLKAYRDVDGNITQFTYDSLGRQASLIDPYNSTTSFTYATTSDIAFPVGAIKRVTNGNGTKTDYTYDSLGRTDRIDYLTPSNNPFDYIDLAYDPVGMITERQRKDGASWYKTVYTYDNAYRLSGETNRTAADVYQTSRTYGYDAGGNRSWMTIQNSGSVNKTTTYAYGNRSQLLSNTGYYREGTTDTGAMTYTWDAKGNMLTRTGQSYEWNEDNRMTRVWVSSGDPK